MSEGQGAHPGAAQGRTGGNPEDRSEWRYRDMVIFLSRNTAISQGGRGIERRFRISGRTGVATRAAGTLVLSGLARIEEVNRHA